MLDESITLRRHNVITLGEKRDVTHPNSEKTSKVTFKKKKKISQRGWLEPCL